MPESSDRVAFLTTPPTLSLHVLFPKACGSPLILCKDFEEKKKINPENI
jgi:hypothetical protein